MPNQVRLDSYREAGKKSRDIFTTLDGEGIPFSVPWEKLKSRVDYVLGYGGFSILDTLKVKSGENEMDVTLRKCSCSSVWCPECYKKMFVPALQEKIGKFDWSKTRHIVLTIDREKFKSGLDAIQYVHEKKSIPGFIRNLQRGKKPFKSISIKRWLWALEWHEDGFPHWHFLIEVSEKGSMGQIGGDMLRHYWGLSSWVFETYFHNARHFEAVAGYYGKQGYFEKGYKCQGKLPDAIKENVRRRIRRNSYVDIEERRIKKAMKMMRFKADFDSMKDAAGGEFGETIKAMMGERVEELVNKEVSADMERIMRSIEINLNNENDEVRAGRKELFSYKMILGKCGKKTIVLVDFSSVQVMGVLDIPYSEMKQMFDGEYKERVGYVSRLNFFDGLRVVQAFERLLAFRFKDDEYRKAMPLYNKTYRLMNDEMMRLEREVQ